MININVINESPLLTNNPHDKTIAHMINMYQNHV